MTPALEPATPATPSASPEGTPRVTGVALSDFRNYERARVDIAPGLTVVHGANGAGKTNLLEAIYLGCTGRSCRTSNEREVVRLGARVARVEIATTAGDGAHLLEVGLEPGVEKRLRVDGARVDRLTGCPVRPLVSVFMPDRLALVKGGPGPRRAHLDQLVLALWPAMAATRSANLRALSQRNALLGRVRAGASRSDLLDTWDQELARHGAELAAERRRALDLLRPALQARARDVGLPGALGAEYRSASRARTVEELHDELRARRPSDIARGFSGHGPHRDDVVLTHGDLALRAYGSQGQQRAALLALLFAERDVLAAERGTAPLMLLDDVTSELDGARREWLVALLAQGGQAVMTTTDLDHVPGARDRGMGLVEVADGDVGAAP